MEIISEIILHGLKTLNDDSVLNMRIKGIC